MDAWCARCILREIARGTTRQRLNFYMGGTDKGAKTMYAGDHHYINKAVTTIDGMAVCFEHVEGGGS